MCQETKVLFLEKREQILRPDDLRELPLNSVKVHRAPRMSAECPQNPIVSSKSDEFHKHPMNSSKSRRNPRSSDEIREVPPNPLKCERIR